MPKTTGKLPFTTASSLSAIDRSRAPDATQRNQIRAALEQSGIDHELVSYPAAGHAYFWPDTPAFNQDARDDSWARLLRLLAD